jgi:major type 1 subunit fimbrin (pilin)
MNLKMILLFNFLGKRRAAIIAALFALFAYLPAMPAMAACNAATGGTTISPPNLTIPRDAVAGTQIGGWTTATSVVSVYCTTWGGGAFAPLGLTPVTSGTTSVTVSGTKFTLYQTGVPGIGMAVGVKVAISGGCTASSSFLNLGAGGTTGSGWASPPGSPWVGGSCNSTITITGSVEVGFFVTGGPLAGGVTSGGTVASYGGYTASGAAVSTSTATVSINPVTVTVLTCAVSAPPIAMGNHTYTEMPSVGSTTASVAVPVTFSNCPASGLSKIQYYIAPTNGTVATNVAALDGTGATGFGIQMLDTSGKVFNFGAGNPYTITATEASSYVVNLAARYYRSSSTITGGSANATMTVYISYQ